VGRPPKHFSHLITPFSGLSYDYRDKWEEELLVCIYKLKMSYGDLMEMPVILRRRLLDHFKKFSAPGSGSDSAVIASSKGKRVRRVGGDALAAKLKSGQLN
jgi:hypothetical protein